MFRKKVMPAHLRPDHEVFLAQAERVEQARRALLSCLQYSRHEPIPIPVGLDLLRDELHAVEADIEQWRRPEVEAAWQECRESLDVARAQIPPARALALETDAGERLLVGVRDCITPLDAWHDAERAWLALRVRER